MAYYSDFNYVRPARLPEILHSMSTVTNEQVAAKFISDAERIIDAYAGPAPPFYINSSSFTTADIPSGSVTFPAQMWGRRYPNYWAVGGTHVTIIGNAAASLEQRLIIASTEDSVTLASGFSTDIPAGTIFGFEQWSRFPRNWDRFNADMPNMPPEIERATALQVEYGFLAGSEAQGLSEPIIADGDLSEIQSRNYASGYSESRAVGTASGKRGLALLIAPRARAELRSLLGVTGWMRG